MSSATSPAPESRKVQVSDSPALDYDEQKFKELILYIAEKSADDPSFGDTKLNKLLFFSDMLHHAIHGTPISGAVYQKLEFGPAPRRLLPVRREMASDKDVAVVRKGRAYARTVTVNRRSADLRLFSTAEIDTIDDVIDLLRNHDATEVSEMSHRLSAGWQHGMMHEDIPYDSIFLSVTDQLTPHEIQRGQALAAELQLTA